MGLNKVSDSSWASSAVLVPKRDKTVRFCVGYRKCNAVTVLDAYPMARIDDVLDSWGKAKYLSMIDLAKGYCQISLDKDA